MIFHINCQLKVPKLLPQVSTELTSARIDIDRRL